MFAKRILLSVTGDLFSILNWLIKKIGYKYSMRSLAFA
ncbi:hypothetical protein BTJ45_01032 [Bacillus mycoides]|nr:hypothetical protein BTJ45_01032 [Bacillus mycoides]